jgi:hypothetical protein
MKKFKNIITLTTMICTFIIGGIFIQGNKVQASQINSTSNGILSDPIILSRFPQLKNEQSKVKNLMNSKEIYVNIQNPDSENPTIKTYNTEQYVNIKKQQNNKYLLNNKSVSVSVPKQNSWIRITLSVYSTSSSAYKIYGYYTWLTSPIRHGNDVISLSHDSHMTFIYSSAWGQNVWSEGGFGTPISYKENRTSLYSSSSNFTGQIGGIAFKFPLGSGVGINSSGTSVYPYGFICVNAMKGNSGDSSAELGLTYAHSQATIAISPSISIPLGTSISVSPALNYDKFNLPYTVRY